jgi:23S rRNA (cytidine2498-2'-O)-methyltransferase
MTPFVSQFIWCACQAGAEKQLKSEMAGLRPEWKFSYSRPGFVTFKLDRESELDLSLVSVFAREYALSLGRVKSFKEAAIRVREILSQDQKPWVLQVFERDRYLPGDWPPGEVPDSGAHRFEAELCGELNHQELSRFKESPAASGDRVLSICGVEDDEWWIGGFIQDSELHSGRKGGRYELALPADVPSRAYYKLEEMIAWLTHLGWDPPRGGEIAVEAGSAPGGASLALLNRGLRVTGIDPGLMDERVMKLKAFQHLRMTIAQVEPEHLPPRMDWLVLDTNLAPQIALPWIERVTRYYKPKGLRGAILTFKLNEAEFSETIYVWLERLERAGYSQVHGRQLSQHRREIGVIGRIN